MQRFGCTDPVLKSAPQHPRRAGDCSNVRAGISAQEKCRSSTVWCTQNTPIVTTCSTAYDYAALETLAVYYLRVPLTLTILRLLGAGMLDLLNRLGEAMHRALACMCAVCPDGAARCTLQQERTLHTVSTCVRCVTCLPLSLDGTTFV